MEMVTEGGQESGHGATGETQGLGRRRRRRRGWKRGSTRKGPCLNVALQIPVTVERVKDIFLHSGVEVTPWAERRKNRVFCFGVVSVKGVVTSLLVAPLDEVSRRSYSAVLHPLCKACKVELWDVKLIE